MSAHPTSSQPSSPRWRAALVRRARWIVAGSAFGLLLPWLTRALAGREDRLSWAVDLAAHWQWLYLAGLVLGALAAACVHRRWLLALLLAPMPWLTAAPPLPSAVSHDPEFVVASANVHVDARDPATLIDWLATIDADLIVLLEVSPTYAEALTASLPGHPHRHLLPSDDPFGMAVLSRHPMQATTRRDAYDIARVEARIQIGDACIELHAIHPMPPLSPRFHAARDALLRELAERSSASDLPTLVVGDLNATPWSSAFAGLAQRGLRRASGLRPTWPSRGAGWFGIPIDQVLASRHWRTLGSALGPDLGSDHLPLLTRLALVDGLDCARIGRSDEAS